MFRGLRTLWLPCLLAACASPAPTQQESVATLSASGRFLVQGDESLRGGDTAAASAAYQTAVDEAVRERNNSNLVEALAQLAEIRRRAGELESAEVALLDAEDRADDEEPLGWSRALLVRALYEHDAGRPRAAQAIFASLFDYCVDHELYDRALDTALQRALQGSLDEKVAWSRRGIELADDLRDERWQAVFWNNLGWSYSDAGQHEDALDAFLEARDLRRRTGSGEERLAAEYAVGRAYRMLGDNDRATKLLRATYRSAEQRYDVEPGPPVARWLGLCQLELAEIIAQQGARSETVRAFRRAYALLIEANAEQWWPEGLRRLERRLDGLMPNGRP